MPIAIPPSPADSALRSEEGVFCGQPTLWERSEGEGLGVAQPRAPAHGIVYPDKQISQLVQFTCVPGGAEVEAGGPAAVTVGGRLVPSVSIRMIVSCVNRRLSSWKCRSCSTEANRCEVPSAFLLLGLATYLGEPVTALLLIHDEQRVGRSVGAGQRHRRPGHQHLLDLPAAARQARDRLTDTIRLFAAYTVAWCGSIEWSS
jgi:hypothetical protein